MAEVEGHPVEEVLIISHVRCEESGIALAGQWG
jgi:hypothetical protein